MSPETRFVPCDACEASGRALVWAEGDNLNPGFFEPGREGCRFCDGGLEEIEVERVTEDEIMRAASLGGFSGSSAARDGAEIGGCSPKDATEPGKAGDAGSNPARSTNSLPERTYSIRAAPPSHE